MDVVGVVHLSLVGHVGGPPCVGTTRKYGSESVLLSIEERNNNLREGHDVGGELSIFAHAH